MQNNVIIIGSGPAGYTAALYAARANLKPLIFEGNQPGGQLTITTDVENYPGFPDGIMGPELMDKFKSQAERFGAKVYSMNVDKVQFSNSDFIVYVGDETFSAKSIIISTGASAKLLGLESEKKLMGYGVSACATCDAFFFKNKNVYVVGGGDSAMEEATFLTKFATKVTIVHRRDAFRASKIMQDKVFKNDKINVLWNTEVIDMLGEPNAGGLKSILVENTITKEQSTIECEGLFLGIGHKPNSDIFKNQLELDKSGYIKTYNNSTQTSIPGVFAAGDIMDPVYRQAITAAGSGCMAALDAEKYIENLHS
jgi:thioredoxin reductase (NADPH)